MESKLLQTKDIGDLASVTSVLFRFMHACSGSGHAPSLQR
jgi:hypothetical protein